MICKNLFLAGILAFSLQLGSLAAPLNDLIDGASMGDLHRVQAALKAGADINGSIYDLETGYEFTEPALVQASRTDILPALKDGGSCFDQQTY